MLASSLLFEPCVALFLCLRRTTFQTIGLDSVQFKSSGSIPSYPSTVNLPYYLLVSTLNMSCTRHYSLIL